MAPDAAPTFPQAVASFEPSSTGVLLWTRLGGGAGTARWVVARDEALADVVAEGEATTGPDRDHTVVVDVDGLEPATTYWYRFEAGPAASPVGRTRTLPGAGATGFRLATVCCARYSVAPLGVYRAVAERDVDLVVHLGDYLYEDDGAKGARDHDPPHACVTLDDYRRRIAQIRSDPDAQALHLRHPVVTIWDDHDLADNAWSGGAKHHDPERDGPWSARIAAAAQARQEWLPARLRDPGDPLVTWRSVEIGDLAELLLLDTRLAGRDEQPGEPDSPALDDPDRSLLGDEQRAWLHGRLADTSRPWAVVASGVVVNEIALPWPRPLEHVNRLLPNGYAVLDGTVMHDDQWDGYPAERARLVAALQRRAAAGGRAVLLSGDVHSSWAFTGPRDEDGEPVAVEVTTPAVSSAAMGRAQYPMLWRLLDRAVRLLDHVEWADVTQRGYAVLDLAPESATASWWFADPYTAEDEPAAAFRTERAAWPPRFEPVDVPDLDRVTAGELPPRPSDLRRLRWAKRARLAAEAGGVAAAVVGGALAAARAASRQR